MNVPGVLNYVTHNSTQNLIVENVTIHIIINSLNRRIYE